MAADNNGHFFSSDNLAKVSALLEVIGDSLVLLALEKQGLEDILSERELRTSAADLRKKRRKRRKR